MDFLDEMVAARTSRNPQFPALVRAAESRRDLLRGLAEARVDAGATQTQVAAIMGTSQSQVARIEEAGCDTRLSTVEKFAAALGKRIEWKIVDA